MSLIESFRDYVIDAVLDRAARRRDAIPYPTALVAGAADSSNALSLLLNGAAIASSSATESTLKGLPAAGFCRDLIANAGAAMMVEAKVLDGADVEVARPHLIDCPNVLIDEFDFWFQVFDAVLVLGNYVALPVDPDADGFPRQALPIHPANVALDTSQGFPIYRLPGDLELGPFDVIHVAAKRPIGSFWGMGVVEQYRTSIRTALYAQQYELNSHATGAVPSAVVQLDTPKVTEDVATQVQNDWIERHGAGQRKPAVVPKSMSIVPLSWSPADAEFIESRQLSIGETAYMFGLQPSDIGAVIATGGATLTYENLTVRQLARLIDSYSPWVQRVERTWSRHLRGSLKVRGNPDALQRMSTKERYELRQLAQAIGIETPTESRALEGRGPAPTGEPVPSSADPAIDDPDLIPDTLEDN